jgi:tRNA nucleotidyltransferase (CCA-adding enzyme)
MTTSTRGPEAGPAELAHGADLEVRRNARLARRFGDRLSAPERAAVRRLARAAHDCGAAVYLVGGVVRDLLLGRPLRDLDFAVDGDVTRVVDRLGGDARHHRAFGTATVVVRGGVRIDLARTRRERYRRPGALPEVAPAGLADDLARRDFSINAMAAPLVPSGLGGLIDPFGGLTDLRRGRVRVLHRRSFVDDPTRAWRAVRAAAELGFGIEPRTRSLLRAAARSDGCKRVSGARVLHELTRTLEGPRPGAVAMLLDRHGLLDAMAEGIRLSRRTAAGLDRVPGVVRRHRRRFPDEPLLAWTIGGAVLLRASAAEVAERALARLRPSRAEREAVEGGRTALRRLPRTLAAGRRLPASVIDVACGGSRTEALLAVVAGTSSSHVRSAVLRYLERLRLVRLEIGGRDLLADGLGPGPAIARALAAARAARLDGRAPGRAAQLRVARSALRPS